MIIREYRQSDLAELRAIHAAQGFDYTLPDLHNPLFVTKLVLLDENVAPPFRAASVPLNDETESRDAGLKPGATQGKILGAAFLRLTAEAYLLLDPRAGAPANAGNGFSRSTPPQNATPGSEALKTSMLGSRRPSRANSANASRASAGSATTPGRPIAKNYQKGRRGSK